jgi:hypothetical protein
MRGKRDSPHQAGVFTRGEGSRKFVMPTIQYDYKQTNTGSFRVGCNYWGFKLV